MTDADHAHLPALRARAERGAPRGATAVLAAAREGLPIPLHAHSRPDRRALGAAAAVLLVAGLGAGVVIGGTRDAQPAAEGAPWCTALAAPAIDASTIGGDLAVYVEPTATVAADLAALAARLDADPRVERVEVADQQEAYERFELLFAGEEPILENVRPDDLPPWVVVHLVDPTTTDRVADELRTDDAVFEVRPQFADVRVLDLLVWPGTNPGVWRNPDTTDRLGLYGPGWDALVAEVEQHTPDAVAPAVSTLVERLAQPPVEEVPSDDLSTARGPTFAEASAAATSLRAAAEDRCDLEVADRFVQQHEVATTIAEGGG